MSFYDDYKKKDEKIIHNGKKVGTKHYGAPENPFEAAKKKNPNK